MRVVVAPDKFKGSLTAVQAAQAIADGLRRSRADIDVVQLPVADGGDGTVAAALAAGYERRTATVQGPTGEPVEATFAVHGEKAVLELAEASGLARLPHGTLAPLTASTYGTGQLLLAALDAGCRHLILGVGGSASTDGGAGMVQALGARFLSAAGEEVDRGGAALLDLDRIDTTLLDPRLASTTVTLACDVDNPLVGAQGAATVYGPQKGANSDDVKLLDTALSHYAEIVHRDMGVHLSHRAGARAPRGAGARARAGFGARKRARVERVVG
ncbi:MAG: glycerate kinase, partial [Nocardioides sp.]|nr:glycerate kinase [Nocardioides sp.]